jgi:excisionase family DNA binding protein
MTESLPDLLTAAEVADVLRVSTMTVYREIYSGQMAAVKVGRQYRVARESLRIYLEERVVEAEGEA